MVERQARHGRIRAVGAGYAVSPLVPTDGSLVSTAKLNRVVAFAPEGDAPWIEVEAGMTMWELNQVVAPFGLRPVMPSLFPFPTLAGLLAVGGHGVGRRAGCFADHVDAIEYVAAEGEVRRIGRGEAGFEAFTTSLGCLGVIARLRVRLERDHRVHMRRRWVSLERLCAEVEDLVASHEGVELLMTPGDTRVALITFDPTRAECTRPPVPPRVRNFIDGAGARLNDIFVGRHARHSARRVHRVVSRMFAHMNRETSWVEWASTAHHFLTFYPRNKNTCFAFDVQDASEAFGRLQASLEREHAAGRAPVNYGVHARFTGPSSSWLSPAYGRPTLQIDLVASDLTPDVESFFVQMEREWLEIDSARPHWGKLHYQPARAGTRYPMRSRFEAVRAEVDPLGVFLNAHVRAALGHASERASKRASMPIDLFATEAAPEAEREAEAGAKAQRASDPVLA